VGVLKAIVVFEWQEMSQTTELFKDNNLYKLRYQRYEYGDGEKADVFDNHDGRASGLARSDGGIAAIHR